MNPKFAKKHVTFWEICIILISIFGLKGKKTPNVILQITERDQHRGMDGRSHHPRKGVELEQRPEFPLYVSGIDNSREVYAS